jgi:hypothetical protein
MSSPKLHHHVPQFYLRRFADNKDRLWAWDKLTDRIFSAGTGRVALATQFYRLTQYEKHGHDPLAMEKQLSELEDEAALITGDWLKRLETMAPLERLAIPRINRSIVALHLAVQVLRTADTREMLSALMEEDSGTPHSQQELREAHTELMWDQRVIEHFAKRFRRSIWVFARNASSTPLIASDNPITFRTGDNRQWRRSIVLSQETYLGHPLSPQVMLYCHPRHGNYR